MKTIALLAQLRSLDVQLWLEGDRLRFDAPEGVLTASWRAELVAHKAEIIAFLRDSAVATRAAPPPLVPVPRNGALPLAFAQQRLWFLAQLDPHSPAYSIPAAVRLIGRLRLPLLQHCLQSIVQRHETLRTSFAIHDGQPVQLIAPKVDLMLPLIDLRALSPARHTSLVEQLARAAARQPFDLACAPLLRVTLLRRAPDDHVLLLVVHHIVADGWSVGVFIRELGARYHAGVHSQSPDLPALPIQYADFAVWQRQWLQGDVLDQQRAYWQHQLAGVPPLTLPSDRPRPLIQSFRGATATFQLPAALLHDLTALSQRHGATLFMTLLATFQVLLARYSAQTDLAVGTPIANRNELATEGLIGCFVNTLVLRAELAGNPSFAALLERTRATCLDAYAHQDAPFDQVVDALQPDRDLSRTPLFQVFFALQSAPTLGAELPDLRLEPLEIDSATAKFDLSLFALEQPQGLRLDLEYATDLFDAPTIARLFSHLQTLSAAIADAPVQGIADLPLLNAAERQQIIGWNATSVAYPSDIPVQKLFAAQAVRTPDAVAVVFDFRDKETRRQGDWETRRQGDRETGRPGDRETTGRTTNDDSAFSLQPSAFSLQPSAFVLHLTYAELDRRANQLAHYLRALDVRPEVRVGIHMPRSPELLIALLGVLKAGGAYLPLDPAYPAERLGFMQEDAQIAVLITQSIDDGRLTIDDLEASQSPIVNRKSKIVNLATDWPAIARQPAHAPDVPLSPDNLAYLIYTSGSTGRPKGVQISHGPLLNFLHAMRQQPGIAAQDTLLAVTSLSFDIAGLELWLPLIVGARLVLADRATSADGAALHRLLERSAATIMQATPATWQLLLAAGWDGSERLHLLCGGEALPRTLADQLLTRSAVLWNMYGPTETTIWSTSARVTATAGPILIGRPIANTQIYVLDTRLQPVPVNLLGDLYIGGAGLSRGYFNRPDLTAERFVPNPFAEVSGAGYRVSEDKLPDTRYPTPATRLYKTGDLARYRPNGDLEFFGRSDQQVKLRGFRIELGEIEARLGQHPSVQACVVLARDEGPGAAQLVAYVVPAAADRTDTIYRVPTTDDRADSSIVHRPSSIVQELRDHLGQTLPDYMIPSAFVLLDALPLTPNGKLDRRALPALDRVQALASEPFVAARTPIEELLSGIWADVLRLERCGVYDNFFALGGHSLLATQVMSRVQAVFQIEIPVRVLFEAPTVADLAERLVRAQQTQSGDQPPPLVPVARSGALPLAFAQQRLWFLAQLDPHSPAYIIPAAVRLTGQLRLPLLQHCLQSIVQRHETLRTSFAIDDGQPVQCITPQVDLALPLLDLCALPADTRSRVAAYLTRAAARQPFDLDRAPLLRVTLLRLAPDDHVLLLVVHHIVADGWSVGVFIHELGARYHAGIHDQPPDLPALPIQYADFAVWQRQWLQGTLLDAQISYWQRQLASLPPLAMPSDRPRPLIQSLRGATLTFRLPAALLHDLTTLSQRHGATLFMTLLAAWQLLLARYSAQTDLAVGTPIAGRTQVATEGLIGCFVNTLVLRADLAGNPSFAALLERTRATCLDAYAHQDAPFDQVVDALQPDRDLSRTPLFQVFFALQNLDAPALDLPDLRLEPLDIDSATAKFDISLYMQETNIGPIGAVEYATDMFDAPTIKRLLGHLQILLSGIAAHPDRAIADLPLLSAHERHQLLVAWNATAADYPHDLCIHQLFAAQAARTPDRIAVVFAEQQISYAELDQRANRLANQLRTRGVGPEICVGICLGRSLELVIGMLAVLQAGGAYVPLDPAYPAKRLAFMLADSRAAVVIRDSIYDLRLTIDDLEESDTTIVNRKSKIVNADNLAYVIYTSGSTGLPKGVAISHRSAVALLQWARTVFAPAQRVLASTSICFDLSVFELFVPLSWGGTIIMAENVLQLPSLPAAESVELINTVPSALAELLHAGAVPSSVHTVNLAGEPLSQRLVQQIYQHPSIQQVFNLYGPSEDTTYSTYTLIARGCSDQPSIGRPIANTQAYVLDAQLRPVAIGAIGELYLGGAGLARGYLNRPELTAERFVPNPFAPLTPAAAAAPPLPRTGEGAGGEGGSRLYRTGDRARYRPDGTIAFLGRIDHQVKLRGFRIELSEIEARLNQQPAVHASVVLAREDTPDNQRLVAYVVPDLPHLDRQALQPEWNAEQLTHWQAVWDAAYAQDTPLPDPTFDTRGWVSSYTGLPIPDEEMQTLVDHTVERIRALRPRAVLEIGCGSGLLLFRLAPECLRYLGTDVSQKALHDLWERLAQAGASFAQVDLLQRPADDYADIAPASVDTLIMNSVTQYFPHITYLVQVLEGALRVVSPGGHIFIGDVRSLPLLETFHSAVQLHHAPGQQSITALRQRIRVSIAQERELVIDPAFFTALQQHFPQISHVDIQLKRGRQQNELTQFRYDVTLFVGDAAAPAPLPRWLDWQQAELTPPALGQLLRQDTPAALGVAGVPNARLAALRNAVERLAQPNGLETVDDLRAELRVQPAPPGIDPEDFWHLGEELPYTVAVSWAASEQDGRYDVVFARQAGSPAPAQPLNMRHPADTPARRPWTSYANNPLREQLLHILEAQLRASLQQQLPEYMIPSAFVLLDALPLTPNGKLDRQALPAPNTSRSPLKGSFVEPSDPLELHIARIWEELLKLYPIGTADNFFDLGGHSLLAVRLMTQIRERFGQELPLSTLFQEPTVAQLAQAIRRQRPALFQPPLVALQPAGTRRPFFCVHALWGSAMPYIDLARRLGSDQPMYGLQSLGIEGDEAMPERIEDMAARYILAIQTVQPHGPYLLGGWSMGGIVAFEMARQLLQRGEGVGLLAIIDSTAPLDGAYQRVALDDAALLAEFIHDLPSQFRHELTTVDQALLDAWLATPARTPAEQLRAIIEQAQRHGLIPADIDPARITRLFHVFAHNLRALAGYAPGSYSQRISVFRASKRAESDDDTPTLGWSRLGPTGVQAIPGDHSTLIAPPHVEVLAAQLREQLDAAQ